MIFVNTAPCRIALSYYTINMEKVFKKLLTKINGTADKSHLSRLALRVFLKSIKQVAKAMKTLSNMMNKGRSPITGNHGYYAPD